jgi:uncharacterized protein (DUF2267 family)
MLKAMKTNRNDAESVLEHDNRLSAKSLYSKKGKRIQRSVLQALRNRLLFEEAVFIFSNLPIDLKIIFAEGWNVRKKEVYEECRFEDVYDFLIEVKGLYHFYPDDRFVDFPSALKAVKEVLLNLYGCVDHWAMNHIIGFLPDDLKHQLLEFEGKIPVHYDSVDYKNIYFILESQRNKRQRKIFAEKFARRLGLNQVTNEAENTFSEFLQAVRDALGVKNSIVFFEGLPAHLKYYYVSGWFSKEEPIDQSTNYWIDDLQLLNTLSKYGLICSAKDIPEIDQVLRELMEISSQGERVRLRMMINHFSDSVKAQLIHLLIAENNKLLPIPDKLSSSQE